ncbi:VQ motif-containing protein 10-like [Magnolia sinica]|uniref:VQ motif-containing protein 10-like n=1 Tax=Magnolia sinica TaxID=86752 RepID=UPI002658E40D|nr:VQ motif-containing protein 10-like [Magnolia sinica]XP_058103628.1 VQ motif-containing protein 10-like [Magnolia sinica]
MSTEGSCPVKVRIIVTEFVETDATSFKSVVQRLTGRDRNVIATEKMAEISNGAPKKKVSKAACVGEDGSWGSPESSEQLEEWERIFMEIPNLDELKAWCAD